jgi:hypothetical protein
MSDPKCPFNPELACSDCRLFIEIGDEEFQCGIVNLINDVSNLNANVFPFTELVKQTVKP